MFSVIIPYYKKRKYIERCLDSVVNQTFKGYEIILVDDGSNDGISEVITSKYGSGVTVIQQENGGVSMARNAGINQAKFPYIAFLDADDFWHVEYLKNVSEVIERESDVKIIGTNYTRNKGIVESDSKELRYYKFENYFKRAVNNTMFFTSATVVCRSFFMDNTGFDPNLKRGEDTDVWIRAVASGGNSFYIKNALVYYSDEDENQATKSNAPIEKTLVGTINTLYQPLLQSVTDPEFSKFVSKYVYFNLYPYFFDVNNHLESKQNLKKNQHHYFLLDLVYWIPLSIGTCLVNSKRFNRYIRLYLKFILRKIIK
jgi:glycosyltransferase involved in cell wall biosynthesis